MKLFHHKRNLLLPLFVLFLFFGIYVFANMLNDRSRKITLSSQAVESNKCATTCDPNNPKGGCPCKIKAPWCASGGYLCDRTTSPNLCQPVGREKCAEAQNTISIVLVGDINIGRDVNAYARRNNDFDIIGTEIENFFLQHDLIIANLESPIVNDSRCPILTWADTKTKNFCGSPNFLTEFKKNKFLFNLANNHIKNFNGVNETIDYLNKNDISYVYSYDNDISPLKFTIKNIQGINMGFLGYDLTGGHSQTNLDIIINEVKENNDKVDILIVSLHWGREYQSIPDNSNIYVQPYGKYSQPDFARALLEAGAEIVHGTHPHVMQPVEEYTINNNKKLIFYSLGNFIFDQYSRPGVTESTIYEVKLSKNEIISYKGYNIKINPENGKPALVNN